MKKEKEKSLKLNMLLNAIKGLMGIIFPLITFPYVTRVLGVENIGKYNFANSVISYFLLLASLGVVTYAVREGAKIRDDRENFKKFADEVFSINFYATIGTYIVLVALILVVPKFHEYTSLLIIMSLQILFRTIGIEWIYSIYEDYAYITIRSIFFQVVSLILLFMCVHSQEDLLIYTLIGVIANVGANVLNYFHSRCYCKVRLTNKINWKKHMKPIMILFAMNITVTIYVSSGTTILGFFCDDYAVGIYSVSTKVYSVVKTVLSSVLIVSIPRLSSVLGKGDIEKYNSLASNIYRTLLTIVYPAVFGIILLRKQIVLIIADSSYSEAVSSLVLISIALLFCMGAYFWGQCVLVPLNKENVLFRITIFSAIINLIINFALIPIWEENAAALGTLIAEAVSFFLCAYEGHKYTKCDGIITTTVKVLVGCFSMSIYILLLNRAGLNMIIYTILAIGGAVILFFAVEVVLKNDVVCELLERFRHKRIKS